MERGCARRVPGVQVDENAEACVHCKLAYQRFRTGLTYSEVRDMLWVNSEDPDDWKYKRRNTVLGKWHEIKLEMWVEHLYGCAAENYGENTDGTTEDADTCLAPWEL